MRYDHLFIDELKGRSGLVPQIVLLTALALACTLTGSGQEVFRGQEQPTLITELGSPDCEFLWSQLDTVASEMSKHPASTLTVDMAGLATAFPHRNIYWYEMLRGYFSSRKLAAQRWQIRQLPLADQWRIQFWLVPPAAKPPETQGALWNFKYPPGTKPFLFTNGESYSVTVGVCLPVDEIGLLGAAFNENPGSRVNAVLIVRTDREFEKRKRQVLKTLAEYSIPRARVRVFKKISKEPNPHGINPVTEYWFLP